MAQQPLDVRAILSSASGAASSRPSTVVDREDDLVYDLGHLYAYDPSPVDDAALRAEGTSAYLLRCARDNAQLLTNQLYNILNGASSKQTIPLPAPTTQLPREKPLPEEKPLTRWEKFAQSKGIVKKKRSKMVWDEATQQWAPRWGYGRANNPKDAVENWVVEAKPGDDGSVDPFESRAKAKKEKLDKQKRQEERNRLEAAHAASIGAGGGGGGRRGSGGGAISSKGDQKAYLKRAMSAAQSSTASMGRFDKMLADEPSRTAGKRKHYETGCAPFPHPTPPRALRTTPAWSPPWPLTGRSVRARGRSVGAAEAAEDRGRTSKVIERMFPESGRKHQVTVNREVAAKRSKMDYEAKQRKAGAAGGGAKGKAGKGKAAGGKSGKSGGTKGGFSSGKKGKGKK